MIFNMGLTHLGSEASIFALKLNFKYFQTAFNGAKGYGFQLIYIILHKIFLWFKILLYQFKFFSLDLDLKQIILIAFHCF